MLRWHNDPTDQGPRWRAEDDDGNTVAYAAKTGTHLDDYPWDWYLIGDASPGQRASGTTDTLRAAKDAVAWATGHGVAP